MSDVPRAKAIIDTLLERAELSSFVRKSLTEARALLDREQPDFKAPPTVKRLSWEERKEARRLRDLGWPILRIADHLGTNIGRVSEAINGKREPPPGP